MTNVGGIRGSAQRIPARIWRPFMKDANAPFPPLDFPGPPTTLLVRPRDISELGRRTTIDVRLPRPLRLPRRDDITTCGADRTTLPPVDHSASKRKAAHEEPADRNRSGP